MEIFFEVSGLSAKRPTGYRYLVVATEEGVAFNCITVNENGRAPSEKDSAKYDFILPWSEIAEIQKPATMFDKLVVFVGKDGKKTQCVFAEDGEEVAAFRELQNTFGSIPGIVFTYGKTPKWKLLVMPIGFTVGMIVVGIVLFLVLAHLEQDGGRMRTNAILVFIYKTIGKYGVLAICVLAGLGGIPWAMRKSRLYDSMDQPGNASGSKQG